MPNERKLNVGHLRRYKLQAVDLVLRWSSAIRFRLIEGRRADYPVSIMCDLLGVSPAGYYEVEQRGATRNRRRRRPTTPATLLPADHAAEICSERTNGFAKGR